MSNNLLLSMITIIILSGTLTFVSFFIWVRGKQRYLFYWTLGWCLYFIHFFFTIADETWPGIFWLNSLGDSLTSFSIIFLLFGVFALREISKYKHRWLWVIPLVSSLWSFYWNYLQNPQVGNIPTSYTFGIFQILIGVILLRTKPRRKYASNTVLGLSMLFWGLHKFDRPVIRYIPHLAPYGYWIGSIFAFITAVSMLLVMVEQTDEERDISTERFRTLFTYSNDIICFFGLDGRILDANPAAEEKYGYRREELLQLTVFQLRSPEDKEKISAQIAETQQKGIAFETVHYKKDKTPIPVEVHAVRATIGGGQVLMSIIRDISERKQAEATLKKMSFTDSLTGLANRRYLDENMEALEIEEFLPVSIIVGDMNGLKLINDAFGHKTGDETLKEMARLLMESCRPNDLVIRWGGDEFLILLPNTGAKATEDLCQRIKQKCQEYRESESVPIQPSIALGYAVRESLAENMAEIFKIADQRMYRNKLLEDKSSRNTIISSLQNTLFERGYETEQHVERLKTMANKMGRIIGLAANQMDDLELLAALHDVGKMEVSEEILSKPGPLTSEEWDLIKKHPAVGYRIIRAIPDLAHIAEAILTHHERWDGTGYPQGLKQTEIPLISRIISIVDSYDVMTNHRSYRKAIPHENALTEITNCAGRQFDPDLVKVFFNSFSG